MNGQERNTHENHHRSGYGRNVGVLVDSDARSG
jgi:hypothetical protein